MAFRRALVAIFTVLIADQALKFYIKTNFYLQQTEPLIGDWFYLNFVENPGMAFGLSFGGDAGKLILTSVRIIASVVIALYLRKLLREKAHQGLIICVAMIFAGAVGNIIDSVFYGLIFNASSGNALNGIAEFMPEEGGYAPFFFGRVVDMFEFTSRWPEWVPKLGGTQIFPPIFNIADAAISVGVITVIIFQKRFFGKKEEELESTSEESAIPNNSEPDPGV